MVKRVVITRRTWQLLAVGGVVVAALFTRHYPFPLLYGLRLGGWIFVVALGLTYLREERRATKSPDSDLVINWNLAESIVFFLCSAGFFVVAFVSGLPDTYIYGYFHTGFFGFLAALILGEFLWQNIRLKELNQVCRDRYWACYKDSIF